MGRPVIGITSGTRVEASGNLRDYEELCYVSRDYIRAIEEAGGLPIVIPVYRDRDLSARYLRLMDGLLLAGGVDLSPHFFGEEPHPRLGSIDIERDEVEMELTRLALELDLPILAICRGIQVLNVAAGGTLYQDISQLDRDVLKHRQSAVGWYGSHSIEIVEGTLLHRIVGKRHMRVNSSHHQAVKDPAEGFRISARAPDGVVEAIESQRHRFILGVQFHPEKMWERSPEAAALFKAFVAACDRKGF